MQSNFALLFSASAHWDQGFSIKTPSFSSLGIKGSFSIASHIPLSRDSTKIFVRTFQNFQFKPHNKGGLFRDAPSPKGNFSAIRKKNRSNLSIFQVPSS